MARINVEQIALTDPRFYHLGLKISMETEDDEDIPLGPLGLGVMVWIWNECQERDSCVLGSVAVNCIGWQIGVRGQLSEMVESADLAVRDEHGNLRIRGTDGRVGWLKLCRERGREGGKKGGRPRKKPVGVYGSKTPGGSAQKTPPALTLTPDPPGPPSPDLSSSKTPQKEPRVRKRVSSANGVPPGFQKWWVVYRDAIDPRPMRDKTACVKLWTAQMEDRADWMVTKVVLQMAYRRDCRDDSEFVPNLPDAVRYLKRKLWKEEIP